MQHILTAVPDAPPLERYHLRDDEDAHMLALSIGGHALALIHHVEHRADAKTRRQGVLLADKLGALLTWVAAHETELV
jgi:hypothetical protein